MNALAILIRDWGFDEVEIMNALQEHGVISDHAIFSGDVGARDAATAVKWISEQDEIPGIS